MTYRHPESMEELIRSYIEYMESRVQEALKEPWMDKSDYEMVLAEHRLFVARVMGAGTVPRAIKDALAAIDLPDRPSHIASWQDIPAAIVAAIEHPDPLLERQERVGPEIHALRRYLADMRSLDALARSAFGPESAETE